MGRSFVDRFKLLDFFARNIELKINGSSGHKTLVGAVFVVLFVITLAIWALTIILTFFSTESPIILSESFQAPNSQPTDLRASMAPAVLAYSNATERVPANLIAKYFTLQAVKSKWSRTGIEEQSFGVVPCAELTGAEKSPYDYILHNGYLKESFDSFALCVRTNPDFFVQGDVAEETFHTIAIKVLPCSLPNPLDCATDAEVRLASLRLVEPRVEIEYSNLNQPFHFRASSDELYQVNWYATQKYHAKVRRNDLYDWRGVLPSWTARSGFYDKDKVTMSISNRNPLQKTCTAAEVAARLCESYVEYLYESSVSGIAIRRKYKEFTQTVAELGGVKTITHLFFLTVYMYYSWVATRAYLIDTAFSFFTDLRKKAHEDPSSQRVIHSDSFLGRVLCCLRKKTPAEMNLHYKEGLAEEAVDSSLDVINLIRELNNLRVITNFFFMPRHFKLIPYLAFNITRKRKLERETLKAREVFKQNEVMGDFLRGITGRIKAIEDDGEKGFEYTHREKILYEMTMKDALTEVRDNVKSIPSDPKNRSTSQELEHHFWQQMKLSNEVAEDSKEPQDPNPILDTNILEIFQAIKQKTAPLDLSSHGKTERADSQGGLGFSNLDQLLGTFNAEKEPQDLPLNPTVSDNNYGYGSPLRAKVPVEPIESRSVLKPALETVEKKALKSSLEKKDGFLKKVTIAENQDHIMLKPSETNKIEKEKETILGQPLTKQNQMII
jgi:serine/threonine protein kinase